MPGSFFDTNVLLYVAAADTSKADRAQELLRDGGLVSVQVLNEMANVLRRKMRLTWAETHLFLATIRDLVSVQPLTVETHERGLGLAERYGLSIYDAMIVAAALDADCDILWSEDMQNGMTIEGRIAIVNPFTQTS